jgi:hypothetical protein
VQLLTASDFFELLSRKNMLALIIFSFLGFVCLNSRKRKDFIGFSILVMKLKQLSHYYENGACWVGAYFALSGGFFGPHCLEHTQTIRIVLCGLCFYFVVLRYAYIWGGKLG